MIRGLLAAGHHYKLTTIGIQLKCMRVTWLLQVNPLCLHHRVTNRIACLIQYETRVESRTRCIHYIFRSLPEYTC
jgi:hypothetical protein